MVIGTPSQQRCCCGAATGAGINASYIARSSAGKTRRRQGHGSPNETPPGARKRPWKPLAACCSGGSASPAGTNRGRRGRLARTRRRLLAKNAVEVSALQSKEKRVFFSSIPSRSLPRAGCRHSVISRVAASLTRDVATVASVTAKSRLSTALGALRLRHSTCLLLLGFCTRQ